MKALTQEQVAAFCHDGFLFPMPALTAEEIATCLAASTAWKPTSAAPSPKPM